ncbi:ABC transporter permease [Flammeovirga kamogawensis]|uniref:ABC transporter permease n=1 Tax=Flammeovirga kamogawensis TaxID=373891 RepID=A0ABX8H1T4_9BACT|nr:ABC transporter permease [Flammeovirga kamogawensis]MBB6463664.1 putative ABC transport system permease protein [Flammeovirga kamogawensis]QWG09277.1 ABC transporter permease [Flammeovirga kamogawensis]TRX64801.1 FtsX-like permease family protein [Flammeovirga kamogawensis]
MLISFLQEPLENLSSHKVRNVTTGLGVSWGLLILILLLGGGEGLYKGIQKLFSGYSKNSVWVYGGQTSMVYNGEPEGKNITFTDAYLTSLQLKYNEIEQLALEVNKNGFTKISYLNKHIQCNLKGVNNDFFDLKNLPLKRGRYFNPLDETQKRNVCIVGGYSQESLFKNEKGIGKEIYIDNVPFVIIGELDNDNLFSQNETRNIFIPLETFQSIFEKKEAFFSFGISLSSAVESDFVDKELKPHFSKTLRFDEKDTNALFLLEAKEQKKSFDDLFKYLNFFLWGVGISLLLSGMISICNMMVLAIKERTKELGIRKALGASPRELLIMIVTESTLLTLFSGVIGILLGVIIIEILNYFIFHSTESKIIEGLEVNPLIIFLAFILLLISGVIAGFIPAKKAMDLTVVNALNEKN